MTKRLIQSAPQENTTVPPRPAAKGPQSGKVKWFRDGELSQTWEDAPDVASAPSNGAGLLRTKKRKELEARYGGVSVTVKAKGEANTSGKCTSAEAVVNAHSGFPERLRHFHHLTGLTQMELSERSGISQAQISDLLRGKFEPKLGTIQALARALSIKARDLIPDT